MPELQAAIRRNIREAEGSTTSSHAGTSPSPSRPGKKKKKKLLSLGQKIAADTRRNQAIDAYRQMKKNKKGKIKQ